MENKVKNHFDYLINSMKETFKNEFEYKFYIRNIKKEKKDNLSHISTLRLNIFNENYEMKISTNKNTALILYSYLSDKKKKKEKLDEELKKELFEFLSLIHKNQLDLIQKENKELKIKTKINKKDILDKNHKYILNFCLNNKDCIFYIEMDEKTREFFNIEENKYFNKGNEPHFLSQDEINRLLDIADQVEEKEETINDLSKEENFLSQDEINRLLDIADQVEEKENNYSIYDFKKPNRISYDEFKNISLIQDKMGIELEKLISEKLDEKVSIKLYSVEQITFGEFVLSIPQLTYINEIESDDDFIYLEMNPAVSYELLNKLSDEQVKKYDRALNENEKNLLSKNFDLTQLIKNYYQRNECKINKIFNNSNYMRKINDEDIVLLGIYELTLKIEGKDKSGFISICHKLETVKSLIEEPKLEFLKEILKIGSFKKNIYETKEVYLHNKEVIEGNSLDFDIKSIEYEEKEFNNLINQDDIINDFKIVTKDYLVSEDLLKSEVDYVSLGHYVNEPLLLEVNGTLIGEAEAVIIEGSAGVKIKKIYQTKLEEIMNKFNIIKYNEVYLLTQENNVLFEIKEEENEFKLFKAKDIRCYN